MIAFGTDVRIERPLEEVFAYVSDPLNFPRWNSAVQAVRRTSLESDLGATYTMERRLPTGRAQNELEIVTFQRPNEFAIRTTWGPTPFLYRYSFASENVESTVHLDAEFELDGVAALLAPLAGSAVKRGADDNFRALKKILEGGPA